MNPLKNRGGPLATGTLAGLVGGMVLLGWALDMAALRRWHDAMLGRYPSVLEEGEK